MIQQYFLSAIPWLLLLFLPAGTAAQHLTVQGAACMRLQDGTVVRLPGNLNAGGAVIAAPAAVMHFDASADRYLEGDVRPGRVIKRGGGTLYFLSDAAVDGILTLHDGRIAVPDALLTLSAHARLVTEIPGTYVIGTAAAVRSVGTGASDFGGLGVLLEAGSDDLGSVTLRRRSGPGSAVGGGASRGIDRVWTLTADHPPVNGRAVHFSWISDDDNGKDLTRLQVWKSTDTGTSWFPVGPTQDASSGRTVTLSVETSFGMYTVSDLDNPFGCVVACVNRTIHLDASGTATLTAADVDAGNYDGCTVASRTLSQATFDCSDIGVNTVTLTIKDANGNASTCQAEITVLDEIPPTITAPADVVVNSDPGACHASGVALGSAVASDNCGVTVTNDAPATFPLGVTTVTWTATDASLNAATATQTVTVQAITAATSVAVQPSTQQYSDIVTFTAEIGPDCGSSVSPATSVTFKVGSQVLGTVPLTAFAGVLTASLTAPLLEPVPFTTPPTGQMAPGTRTVTAVFNNVSPGYGVSDATTSLVILPEHATPVYTGIPFISTPGVSNYTATIPLAATIVDAADASRGDIRNARVTFRMDDPGGSALGTASLQPVLVSSVDPTTGTVATSTSYTLNGGEINARGTSFVVYTVLDAYYRNILSGGQPDYDEQVITISLPGSDAVTGGGFLVMQNSSGYWTGTTGRKMNFGFTMKYNPSGNNLQGQANIIFRARDSVFQIKSNAINTLSVNASTQEAWFNTKANLKNVTDPANPVSLGGNLDLTVSMRDVSTSGAGDEISVQLSRQNGQLLFSSHWSGTQTVRRTLSSPTGGGNIRVRSSAVPKEQAGDPYAAAPLPEDLTLAQNYPNPFNPVTTIAYGIPTAGAVRLTVFDLHGRMVATLVDGHRDAGTYVARFDGNRLPSGIYAYRLEWNGHVLVKTMSLVK